MELHIYLGGIAGWCVTPKHPLQDEKGDLVGVTGISRDFNAPSDKARGFVELAKALRFMQAHYTESLRIDDIAKKGGAECGVSV